MSVLHSHHWGGVWFTLVFAGVAFGGVLVLVVGVIIQPHEVTAGGDRVSWMVREQVGWEAMRGLPGGSCRPWRHCEVWGVGVVFGSPATRLEKNCNQTGT